MNSVTPASYIHALRPVRNPPQGVSGAVRLQKRVELRARQDGLRLLEGLDLLVTGGLAVVKVLKHKIACSVELGLGGGEVLQFGLRFLQRRLRLGLLGFRLRLLLGLIVDGLVRINDRRVRFLHEVLVRRLRVLLALRARDSAGVVDVLICFEQESVIAKEALRVATLARNATQFKTSCVLSETGEAVRNKGPCARRSSACSPSVPRPSRRRPSRNRRATKDHALV